MVKIFHKASPSSRRIPNSRSTIRRHVYTVLLLVLLAPCFLLLARFFHDPSNNSISHQIELETRKAKIDYGKIMMSRVEVDKIISLLNNVNTYIEWGSGGSTLNYPKLVPGQSYSVEHNSSWCSHIESNLRLNLDLARVKYYCVAGSTGKESWDNRVSKDGTYLNFKDYVNVVDKLNQTTFDFVLIDGRARLPVAVKILSYISPNTTVILHDSDRLNKSFTNYSRILRFYDLVEEAKGKFTSLAILRRKQQYDRLQGNHLEVQQMLENAYKYD